MKLIFTDQYANVLFLVNGLAILFYLAAKKKKRQRAMKFGNYETLQKVAGKNFLKSSNVLLVTRILALTALIVGISNPVVVKTVSSTNSDYVLAVDSSGTMLTPDIKPNRLQAAKDTAVTFVGQVSNDTRVGVISFSGEVKQESDLSSDKKKVRESIDSIETGEEAGTATGDALYTATSMLLGSSKSREIILITDGESNVGSPMNESIQYAKDHNVSITTIGIGSRQEQQDNFGTVNGVNASRAEFPNIDTQMLNRTAAETGGKFVTATNITSIQNTLLDFEEREVRHDISIYFIFLALGLMLLEWILGTTRYSILP